VSPATSTGNSSHEDVNGNDATDSSATASSDRDTFALDYDRMQYADNADRRYYCPFMLGLPSQPVFWNGHCYEAEYLQGFLRSENARNSDSPFVPCPVTRADVSLAAPVRPANEEEISSIRAAQERYESRNAERDALTRELATRQSDQRAQDA